MAINSDIRDQAYQFFIQEAPELLQVIEAELLTLKTERSTAKVHNMMRAVHSIKGGSASVGLETIKTLAHSLEDIFKALHSEELEIDTEIESLLLQAYDCLRLPLIEQITTGQLNEALAMANAEPVFAQITARLVDFLSLAADLPSSIELGVDIVLSIFEVDVVRELERLRGVLAAPQGKEVAGELRAQAEVFSGIAELLNLPGFGAIASSAIAALDAHPEQALQITSLALADFQAACLAVIAGDRTEGGAPSAALAELATQELHLDSVEIDQEDNNQELVEQIIDAELVEQASAGTDLALRYASPVADEVTAIPTLDDVFGNFVLSAEPAALDNRPPPTVRPTTASPQELHSDIKAVNAQDTAAPTAPTPQLSVRVDLERLERMNNLVGELAINRNSLSLQNEQLQGTVQQLLRRFAFFKQMGNHLRALSDQMLVAPRNSYTAAQKELSSFDSLEMDSYGELHSLLSATLEEIVQLEEKVGDVVLLAGQSSQTLERQRQMLGNLQDDVMRARMLPLGEVLNRFPRILRDLSTAYDKPVNLKLSGTGVLVDKAALEKLSDPLLHLLRNAFDHGIEMPSVRLSQGKPEQGKIEIRAYHQGSQTIIEVKDDGRGLDLDRIKSRALDMGLLSPEQVVTADPSDLLELLFQPGFSTATQVSELSGRGVGLDVVRSQVRSLKGTVTVTSSFGIGTTFTLRIPLTLTIAKLLIGFIGSTAFALPSDSIEEILIPKPGQVKHSGGQRFLHWRSRIVPAIHLSEILNYACPLPEIFPSAALEVVPSPEDWAPPMLLLAQDDQILALEIDRLVSEQELVIKPFGAAIAPPNYMYGCTILGDGSLIPVIDGAALLNVNPPSTGSGTLRYPHSPFQRDIAPTVLVVDDSIAVRQTLALTLQKAGYRVLQARDGREAIEQLQKNSTIQLVVCDIEMPNMNGFKFLTHRRQDPLLAKIPTVMLTSRSSDKHRQLAMHLGANAYFTKPYIDQEFLVVLQKLVEGIKTL